MSTAQQHTTPGPFVKRSSHAPLYGFATLFLLAITVGASAKQVAEFASVSFEDGIQVASVVFSYSPEIVTFPNEEHFDISAAQAGAARASMMGQRAFDAIAHSKKFSPALAVSVVLPDEILPETSKNISSQSSQGLGEDAARTFAQKYFSSLLPILTYFPSELGKNGLFIWDHSFKLIGERFVEAVYAFGDAQAYTYRTLTHLSISFGYTFVNGIYALGDLQATLYLAAAESAERTPHDLARMFIDKKLQASMVCVGNTCVTEEEFLSMVAAHKQQKTETPYIPLVSFTFIE